MVKESKDPSLAELEEHKKALEGLLAAEWAVYDWFIQARSDNVVRVLGVPGRGIRANILAELQYDLDTINELLESYRYEDIYARIKMECELEYEVEELCCEDQEKAIIAQKIAESRPPHIAWPV